MTRNIVDIIKEQTMNDQPAPTEKAQIVVSLSNGPSAIFRFTTVKKGEKEYKALLAAWKNYSADKQHADINGDMFIGRVNLSAVIAVCFVDHVKRNKFVPISG